MKLTLSEQFCFVCGKKQPNSQHHAIPIRLNPVHNVIIPVCEKCHTEINRTDFGALSSFTFKMMKTVEEQLGLLKRVDKMINEVYITPSSPLPKKEEKKNE